jgi:2-polyprenyl-3-methyl-5-hydroxy-6-metoxy-1,4-benzoquinol methylase
MPRRDIPTEYAGATIYDLENSEFEPIGPFCLGMARRAGGPVLDLGCGTGRFTIPLAQHGFETCGLDVAPAMLARAREDRREATSLSRGWRPTRATSAWPGSPAS